MITNKDIKTCNEQLFSYSAAYQVPFFGREEAIQEMQELAENLQEKEVIVISQPLGTGKTFLVNYMISNGKLDIPNGTSFLTVRGITEEPESLEEFPGNVLIVDEADIKTPIKKLVKGIGMLADYLEESGRKAILLGDYSLKNDNISGKLEHTAVLQHFGDMDREFLKGVLKQRFTHFLKQEEFQLDEVMEPELIDYLVPGWMKAVNSFRGIFSLLQQVVANENYIRYNGDKAYLTADMLHDFITKDNYLQLDKEQETFLKLLREYIREIHPKGQGITKGFTANELYDIANSGGMKKSIKEFMEEILYTFASVNLLVSTGVPEYSKGQPFVRYPAPYVPSLRLLLSAL